MWRLLGGLLLGALAVGVTACVVKGIIDRRKLQQAMRDEDFREAWIDTVDRHAKKVKLKDVRSGKYLEVKGDDIASDIHEGDKIYA
jgi:hypothetical protein